MPHNKFPDWHRVFFSRVDAEAVCGGSDRMALSRVTFAFRDREDKFSGVRMGRSSLPSIVVGMGALRSNPLRAVLSTLGVIIGVASLVAILSIGDSLEQFSRDQIVQTTDLQSIVLSSVTTEVVDGIRIELDDPIRFSGEDFLELVTLLRADAVVVPMVSSSARAHMDGDTITSVVLVTETIPEALPRFADGVIRYGSFIHDAGTSGGSDREAVLSMSIAKRMANGRADSLLLGKTLVAQNAQYNIVGILNGDGTGTPRIVVPIDVAGDFGQPETYPTFTIRAVEIEGVQSIVGRIEGWLVERFGDADKHFSLSSSQARVDQVAKGMLVFKLALGAIAAISLIVGGIGIMNVLLASVAERTREIGVRKAMGARKSDILLQFLAESVSITGFGAVVGTLLGLVASASIMIGIKSFTGAPVGVAYTWMSILLAAVAAVVIGIVFGMFPAVRASRLSPVDAIRHE